MRTTLDLDDSVLEAAREVAHRTRRSIGAVISEWAKRGSASPVTARVRGGKKRRLPTFAVRPDSPPIDLATEQRLLDDEL